MASNTKRDKFGFKRGSKTSTAIGMYGRKTGATTAQVSAKLGGPYLNCLKVVENHKDFSVVRIPIQTKDAKRKVYSYRIVANGATTEDAVTA